MDNDSPSVASDMASENIFSASNFWTDCSLEYFAPAVEFLANVAKN